MNNEQEITRKLTLSFRMFDDGTAELSADGIVKHSLQDAEILKELVKQLRQQWPYAAADALNNTTKQKRDDEQADLVGSYLASKGEGKGGRAGQARFLNEYKGESGSRASRGAPLQRHQWSYQKNELTRALRRYDTDAAFRSLTDRRSEMFKRLHDELDRTMLKKVAP